MSFKKWNADAIPDLKSKTAIVTGANIGIGFATALELARHGAGVFLACRSREKGELAAGRIKEETKNKDVTFLELDLGDLASVRRFAAAFTAQKSALDILVNNAGIMMPPYTKTKDGFEIQFGVNHLGHFALTGLLLKSLCQGKNSRVVSVSSMAHKWGKIKFSDLQSEKKYRKTLAYGQSKLANLLFTYELQRRLEKAGKSVIGVASHPGWTATDLQRYARFIEVVNPLFAQKPAMGALPSLYAAVAGDVRGGEFFGPGGWMELRGYPKKVKSNTVSHNEEIAAKLWDISEQLTGVKFLSG